MADLLKNLPSGVQAELYTRQSKTTQVSFINNDFENSSDSNNLSATLRVIKDGKMSSATSSKPDSEMEMFDKAMQTVRFGSAVNYDFPGKAELADIKLSDEATTKIEFQRMAEIGEDLAASLRNYDSHILAQANVNRNDVTVNLTNSNGFVGSYRKTVFSASLSGRLIKGQDFLRLGDTHSSISPELDVEQLKKEVIQLFDWSKTIVPFESGSYPVIFAPDEVGFLMMPFISCLNGKAFTRGMSPWKEYMGQQILDPRVTLIDDGTIYGSTASAPFDREGTPTRRSALIEAGTPQELLLDLETAKMLGKQSTGHGALGVRGPLPHHLFLAPGNQPLEEIIKGIDKGLIVFSSMGAWTGNPFSGNVTGTIAIGLKIERGQIVGRVKNCMFSVNSFNHFLKNLIGMSQEVKDTGARGGIGASFPYVALADVVIVTDRGER